MSFEYFEGPFRLDLFPVLAQRNWPVNDDPLRLEFGTFGRGQHGAINDDQLVVDALGLALQCRHDAIGGVAVRAANQGPCRRGDLAHPARPVLNLPEHVRGHLVAGVALEPGRDLLGIQAVADEDIVFLWTPLCLQTFCES